MSPSTIQAPPPAVAPSRKRRFERGTRSTPLSALGEPWLWLCGGALALALAMIVGLLALIFVRGGATFWPRELVRIERKGTSAILGDVAAESLAPVDSGDEGAPAVRRRMLRTGNFDLTGEHFQWVRDDEITAESKPQDALVVERRAWGLFHGTPVALIVGDAVVADAPDQILARFESEHERALERLEERERIEHDEAGAVNADLERERLALRKVELAHGRSSDEYRAAASLAEEHVAALQSRHDEIGARIAALNAQDARDRLALVAADGTKKEVALSDIVRAFAPNELSTFGKLRIYAARWWEFLSADPREANSAGGVFPAIFGTVVMTLLMSLAVVPFGVLAALYLREYAKAGVLVSAVRICVNNLAGVPSIVFGVFGLGFFCSIVGTSIDELLFAERLPNPTYGKGGLLWASLTLALLTLPVVIVATEEAISAVPNSMREGSYGCGATKWQTIRRIVLPRALPGIMTGMILAIARGAGEVAPLMLVGAVKVAPELLVDSTPPFVHPERSFLHLGFHIFDLGFQSQNSEAAKPMVFTTTLLLIAIVVALNLAAIWIRARLRARFSANPF